MKAYERFIEYAKIHTASAEGVEATPTAERQFDLTHYLEKEMKEIGLSGVYSDEHAYVYGFLPASEGLEDRPCVGFISHIDTVPDFSGENVKPVLVENYDGGDIVLGSSGRVLSVEQFPHLASYKGQTIITTDGTTVLGSDDKAGIAEIMTACEQIINESIPHGPIAVCFNPDEEVGHGAALLDIERFGADFAFTVDGGEPGELSFETFNAAAAVFEISGFNIHPGSAKNKMINASLVAMEINSMLPSCDTPANTEGYQGFFHLTDMEGTVESAKLCYIVRDHDAVLFEGRKKSLEFIAELVNAKYGEGTVKLTLVEQYRNMVEVLKDKAEVIDIARKAITAAGLEVKVEAVRGGTDGSQLSFRGLPCPNLGTGGYCFHGPYEHIPVINLDLCTEVVKNIVKEVAGA